MERNLFVRTPRSYFFFFFFLYLRRATGAFLPPYAPDMETRAVKMSTMIACWEMILHKTRCPLASFLPSLPSRSLSLFRLSLFSFSHTSRIGFVKFHQRYATRIFFSQCIAALMNNISATFTQCRSWPSEFVYSTKK